ncbi:Panacea domain-containing protein [Actinoplanes sp. NPDC051494]|uniref:Panacea domain-containing protein n=1 Tax=Actinoplanes sp. NPDC051494 TaxID=3363907 RepID=UPI0037A09130
MAAVISDRVGRPGLDLMSLQKLLYHVQAWHLAIKDEPLFEGHFEAWPEGPVVPGVQEACGCEVEPQLDDQVSDLVGLVVLTYGALSSGELTTLVKTETPWLEARGDLPDDAPSATVISHDAMAGFVRSHRELYGFSAADLSWSGLYIDGRRNPEPFNDDEFLASLGPEYDEPAGENPWPTAFGDYKLYIQDDRTEEHGPVDSGA